ncbi:MAG: V-type ATPase subunit [Firmicutes bacterium]|nr:V-type ATPase subunit [Bacillota bacterium]
MNYEDAFAYAVARVRVLENRMIDSARFNRMLEAADLEEFAKILAETEYAQSGRPDPRRYEEMIDEGLGRAYDTVGGFSPVPYLTGVFRAQHDFHNLKVHLKASQLPQAAPRGFSPVGWLGRDEIRVVSDLRAGAEIEDADFPVERDRAILQDALRQAGEQAIAAYRAAGQDPQYIDMVVDRATFDYYQGVARLYKAAFLEELIAALADLTNIRIYMRLRAIGKPSGFFLSAAVPHGSIDTGAMAEFFGEPVDRFASALSRSAYAKVVSEGVDEWQKTGSLRRLEALADAAIAERVRETRYLADGYEPVLGYLMARENEASTLRRICVGKVNDLPPDTIRERLCEGYA